MKARFVGATGLFVFNAIASISAVVSQSSISSVCIVFKCEHPIMHK
jgi:hypothetical protein